MNVTRIQHEALIELIYGWSVAGDQYKADTRRLMRNVLMEQNKIREKKLTEKEIEDTVTNDIMAQTLTYVIACLKIDLPSAVAYVRAMTEDGTVKYKSFSQESLEKYYEKDIKTLTNTSRLLLNGLDKTIDETVALMMKCHEAS